MAITQNPHIGRTKGSYGGATLCTLNGQNIIRAKAIQVANPQTDAQQANRKKQGFLSTLSRFSRAQIDVGLAKGEQKHYSFNRFVMYNQEAVTVDMEQVMTVDYAKIQTSRGNLPPIAGNLTVSDLSAGISIQWTNTEQPEYDNDLVTVTAIQEESNVTSSQVTTSVRNDLNVSVNANFVEGKVIHIYIAAYNPTTKEASNSTYISYTMP